MTALVALAGVALVGCQSIADGSLPSTTEPVVLKQGLSLPDSSVLGVKQLTNQSDIALQFAPNISAATAAAMGRRYGLEITGGPLVSGPLAPGLFTFTTPHADVVAVTPTTATVYFPSILTSVDRNAYLTQHNLQLIRWVPMDDMRIALVRLPASQMRPTLIDPMQGLFHEALPGGLEQASVVEWATSSAMNLIHYDPATGSTVVRPAAWRPFQLRPPVYALPPTTSPVSTLSHLYVQFVNTVTTSSVDALARKLGLVILSVTSSNLVVFGTDKSNTKAAIQLLSDNATVQCVKASSRPCSIGATPSAGAPAPAPTYAQPTSVSMRVVDGLLEVRWPAATGATAYAISRTSSLAEPYQLVAIVGGHDTTSFIAIDQTAPGSTVYYQVVALHPCTLWADAEACDVAVVSVGAAGARSVGWTNPIVAPDAAQATDPQPLPSPSPADQATDPAAPTTQTVEPSPVVPPPPVVAPPPPPTQTRVGQGPLAAPGSVNAAASDGHVVVGWQPVQGATAYRVYRSSGVGASKYVATTSETSFTDTSGIVGSTYAYVVSAEPASGLVGALSAQATATWQHPTSTPVVLRSLPAQAAPLAGRVRLEVDARSGDGRGHVDWRIDGPAARMTIGTAAGVPSATAPLSWSAAVSWNAASVPNGTYTITTTVTGTAGDPVTLSTLYRIQNGAPIGPTHLSAVSKPAGVALTWQQPTSAVAVSYRVYRDQAASGPPLAELSADRRSFIDSAALPGRHTYLLVLVDAGGRASKAARTDVRVASISIPESATDVDLQVLLPTGQPVAAAGRVTDRLLLVAPAADGLSFQLSSDGATWGVLGQAVVCADKVCTLDLSTESMIAGAYRVRAMTSHSTSAEYTFVKADAVRYSAPTALAPQLTGIGVELTWTAPAGALPASYTVSRRVAGGEWQLLDQVAGSIYIDATAPGGLSSDYRVSAVDPEGTAGVASDAVTIAIPSIELAELEIHGRPPAPSGVKAITTQGRAFVSWKPATSSDGYLVERQLAPSGAFAAVGTTSGTAFVDTPALTAAEVTYRIVALDGVIEGSASADVATLVVPVEAPPPLVATQTMQSRPAAPSMLKATAQRGAIALSWKAGPASAPASTYNVYRLDPANGGFALAASGLSAPSFMDSGLVGPARFGYVVSTSSSSGSESQFSDPVWVNLTGSAPALTVGFVSPTAAQASALTAQSLRVLAQVMAAAGVARVSFAIAPLGGAWKDLPAAPANPRGPAPSPAVGATSAALWGSTLTTTSLAPGAYKLRVVVSDRAGRTTQQVRDLLIAPGGARGPPTYALSANPIAGGVHLEWNDPTSSTFILQRSLFGPDGPFETITTTQSAHFDDRSAIPGQSYWYRTLNSGLSSNSTVAIAIPLAPVAGVVDGLPTLQLGAVSASELSVTVEASGSPHALTSNLHALGGVYDVNAASLASGQAVHRLGESTQVTFQLPPGTPRVDAGSAAVYHWDEASGAWLREVSTIDPTGTSIVATVDHLSEFVLAAPVAPAGDGGLAQPPAPPTSSGGSQSPDSSLNPPPSPLPYQVAADGEVISLRSANSSVYLNADGSYKQTISATPINYQDSAGLWQKIATDLVVVDPSSGYLRNSAGPLAFELPSSLGTMPIKITTLSGAMTTFLPDGMGLATGLVSGNQVIYGDVLSGVDAKYTVLQAGLKEELIINSPPQSAPSFTFNLSTGSLVLQQQEDGSIDAIDPSGQMAYVINAPWMHDSATAYSELGETSRSVSVTLTGSSGSYKLTYTPDSKWLLDASRIFPVILDPSFSVDSTGGNEFDDQINSLSPSFNYHGYTYLPIGYAHYSSPVGDAPSRAMLQFNGFLFDGRYATSASLNLYQYTAYGTGRGNCCVAYQASAAAASWSYTGVTWNNQPGYTNSYGSATSNERGSAGWLSWDVTTLVRSWELHSFTNYGFVVHATGSNESGPNNTQEEFYGGNSATSPYLTITYDSYLYSSAIALATGSKNVVPNGGTTKVEVLLSNIGTATWGPDTNVSYRWWSGASVTTYAVGAYMPYSVQTGTTVVLRFALATPTTFTGPVSLQLAMVNATFSFSALSWGSGSYACDQFYYVPIPPPASPSCASSSSTAITMASESGSISWQGAPQVLSAVAGSLLTIPITIANTSTLLGGNYSWRAYNNADLIRVGVRDYRTASGTVSPLSSLPNLKTYLVGDLAPQAAPQNLNAVIQAPGEAGDYLLRIDLVRDTPTGTTWFADQGNAPLEVRARIVAPGDDNTTDVPISIGDGSSVGVDTSDGFATVSATDIDIAERGDASLHVGRYYNGENGLLGSVGTGATSATYGLGWTFDFQRSLHLGSLGTNTYDPSSGILTDANGKAFVLTWNSARGLYEDAAGNRIVAPSTSQVVAASTTMTVPGVRPVDLINGSGTVITDGSAPGGYALKFESSGLPTALVLPSGLVPVQQNGTIEFWFKPNFDMSTDLSCHVFFADGQMRFGLAWNCPSGTYPWGSSVSRAVDFFTYDADTSTYDILSTAGITWAAGGWHHISLTWAERGAKQLMTDTTLVSQATHYQSPIGDLVYGYQANASATALNYLNGRITQLRVDGRVVPGNGSSGELYQDALPNATLNASSNNTLYLGHYDAGSVQSSAGTYQLRNSDQSIENYSPLGVIQSESDRFGNQIDYIWDANGRIQTVADHAIAGRTIAFTYGANSFTATDFAGRTVTYQLNASGDLVSVTRGNQVPDPRTGTVTNQNITTSYVYGAGHLLQQVIDPRGAKTTLNYDQSYRQVVLIDNPTAYWRLGETTGSTATDSAATFTGTRHGGITLGQGGATWGDANLAYKFDGTSAYVSVPYTATLNPATFTIEAWAILSGGQGTRRAIISTASPGTSNTTGFELAANASNQWMVQIGVGSASWGVVTGPTVVLNQWTYLAATYASGTLSLYVNGKLQGSLSTSYVVSTTREVDIGADYFAGSMGGYFVGKLDEVALTPRALAVSRIQSHSAAGRLGVAANPSGYAAQVELDSPIAYWRLDEDGGFRALDQSGSANSGKYSGGYSLGQPGALTSDPDPSAGFDGSTGTVSVSLPNIDTVSGHQTTVEFWMYLTGASGQMPFGFNLYDLYWVPASGFGFNSGTGDLYGTAPEAIQLNTWLHVAAVFTNGAFTSNKIYINGVLQTLSQRLGSAASKTVATTANISGWTTSGSYKINGNVDEVAVYNGALTATQVQTHFAAGRLIPANGDPYVSAVTADRPLGYWRLDEASGTVAAESTGSSNAGTYSGGYTLRQPGAPPNEADSSTRFDGSTGTVSLSGLNLNATTTGQQYSVEFWMYWDGSSATQMPFGFDGYDLFLNYPSVGNFGFNTAVSDVYGVNSIQASTWLHIVAVFTNNSVISNQLYINGIKQTLTQQVGTPQNKTVSAAANISGFPTTGSYKFHGEIDDVAIYPGALSASRVLAHYQAGRLAPIPVTGTTVGTYADAVAVDSPVGFWRFDEPSGTTAFDKSGSNNAGAYTATGVTLGQSGSLAADSATAAAFDGTSGGVQVPGSASLNVGGPLTIEAWIKKSTQNTGPIVEYNNGTSIGVALWNYPTWDALYINFVDTSSGNHTVTSSGGVFKTGLWYHVVATYDGAYGTLYVNGAQVARASLGAFTPQTSYSLYGGKRASGTPAYFAGSIDDVAVFASALTPTTIADHYRLAWDPSRVRVASVQDGRGNTVDRFAYNDDSGVTQVVDGVGLPSYYTFQQYGGRTLSITDTGNNVTRYEFEGGAPYRLTAVISPTGVRHSRLVNSGAAVGMQDQTLIEDDAAHPATVISAVVSGSVPDAAVYGATTLTGNGESWIWDPALALSTGTPSHRTTGGVAGFHEHYLQFTVPIFIPAGSSLSQWVYVENVSQLPTAIQMRFRDASGWTHVGFWGTFSAGSGSGCPANCPQGPLPVAGYWVQLTVPLGPSAASPLTTTTVALIGGTQYTSLSVAALPVAIPSGTVITVGQATNTFQTVVTSATASAGAITIAVAQFTANATYAVGTKLGANLRITTDVGMAGSTLTGIGFGAYGGTGAVWWGPTTLEFPGPNVTDPIRPVSRYSYNATNDTVASIDPNGLATINDFDSSGMLRASSSGVEPAVPITLAQDGITAMCTSLCSTNFGVASWTHEFGDPGTSATTSASQVNVGGTLYGSLAITHTAAGLQSDLLKDFGGLSPGAYVRVSVWLMTSSGSAGTGGGSLMIENAVAGTLNVVRRTASTQTSGLWVQLTLPFVADTSGQLRVHLLQENFAGTTTWADLTIDDLTPAPDVLLQRPLGVYATGFENPNEVGWSYGTTPAAAVSDATLSHGGQYALRDSLLTATTTNTVSRSLSLSANAVYRITAWVKTVVSGGNAGANGAQLCAQFTGSNCSSFITTEGQWQQIQLTTTGSGVLVVQLVHQNFQGDLYWDDINVELLPSQTPASSGVWRGTSWTGTVSGSGSAIWSATTTGGVGGENSRQVTVSGTPTDVKDTLTTAALRTNATYVISAWVSSSIVNTTISFWLNSSTAMDTQPATCVIQPTPTLCQNTLTYTGADRASASLVVDYGATAAVFNLSHVLIALARQRYDYTSYGQVNHTYDLFGHSSTITFDANSLYSTQTVITATPSPNLTTNSTFNSLGQLVLSTRVNGAQSIAQQVWVDSWGHKVGEVQNCVTAVAPPGLCNASPDPATNVMTRYAYDLNGNLIDQYDQGQVSGTWVQTHYLYDANNNPVAAISNCVTTTNPCDAASTTVQNVVRVTAYDALNRTTDSYTPLPGCAPTSASCVPVPTCSTGPPPSCVTPSSPCPNSSCVDTHSVYDTASRLFQSIANFGGTGDVSTANLTTQYTYDGDDRLTNTYLPVTSATLQTGQIADHRVYDAIGRLVTDTEAYSLPTWMASTTSAQTDYTLDAGGRIVSVKAPDVGTATFNSNRVVTTTDYDDLGRPLSVTVDPAGLNATSKAVYDPRGHMKNWTPPTQQLSGGLQTTQNSDLAGHVTSVVTDDGSGGLQLTSSTAYDGYGRATDVTDPRGIVTHTAYDSLDRATAVTLNYCPVGNANSNCTGSSTLPDQNVTTSYVYDLAGNPTQTINPRGVIEYTAFDALRRSIAVSESCQTVPTPPATSCGTQSSDQNVLTTQTFDQAGSILTTTDPVGRINRSAYDALGRKLSLTLNCVTVTNPCDGAINSGQNLKTQWQYDAQGDALKETSPRNLVTGYTYDGLLRLASVIEDQGGLGHTTTYTHDPSGNLLSQTDGLGSGHTTSYTIDNLGRTTRVTDAGSNQVQTNYSLAGEVISTVNARGKTNANTLDRVGRAVGVSYYKADGTTALSRSFGYDADGNQTSFADTDVAQTTVTYDHLSRPSTVTASSPYGTTTYTYFMDGAVNSIIDANGTTTFTEDRLGRPLTMVDPLNSTSANLTTYSYDAAGRLTTRVEKAPIISKVSASTPAIATASSSSVATSWQADEPRTAGDLLIASGSSVGGSTLTITAGWTQVAVVVQGTLRTGLWYKVASGADAAPTISSTGASKAEGSVSEWKGNDAAPLQSNSVGSASASSGTSIALSMGAAPTGAGGLSFATYAEHLTANATASEVPSAGWLQEGVRTASDNDHLGRDYRINPSTASADTESPAYTTAGTVDAIAGIVAFFKAATGGIVTTVSYTGADQLASKSEVAGATTLANWTNVTYDLDENRTAETLTYYAGNPYPDAQSGTPSGSTASTYQYDTEDQLSQAALPGLSAKTYGYNAAHDLTTNAAIPQTYNSNESLQTVNGATTGSDADGNQLKDVNGNALSWNSLSQLEKFSTTETYTYDALGRLTTVTNGASMTKFVYEGLSGEVIRELDSSNAVVRSYEWDDSRQLYAKVSGSVYYEITNPHGDVVAWASTTALVGTQHFDPWGNLTTMAGTTTPFGFQGSAGSWGDPTSGFVSMGLRWYYPKVGAFLSSDPAAGTANPRTPIDGVRWLYASNDPLDNSDPSGSCTEYNSQGDRNACWHGSAASHKKNTQRVATQQAARDTCDATCRAIMAHRHSGAAPKRCCDVLGALKALSDDYNAVVRQDVTDFVTGFGDTGLGLLESTPPLNFILEGAQLLDSSSDQRQEFGIWLNDGHPDWDSYQRAANYQAGVEQNQIIATVKNWEAHPFQLAGSLTFVAATFGVGGLARGPSAASGTVRVGRWMSADEHNAMMASGMVQEGGGGVSAVSYPANIAIWELQAAAKSRYIEFSVPSESVRAGGSAGWGIIDGPNSNMGRFAPALGRPIPKLPRATDIRWVASRIRL